MIKGVGQRLVRDAQVAIPDRPSDLPIRSWRRGVVQSCCDRDRAHRAAIVRMSIVRLGLETRTVCLSIVLDRAVGWVVQDFG